MFYACSVINTGVSSSLINSYLLLRGLPGSPGSESLFFASPKKSNQKKGDPQSGSLRFASGTLRCSGQTEILETCLLRSLRTSKIFNPSAPPLLSPARTGGGRIQIQIRGTLSPLRALNGAMFLVASCARIIWANGLKHSKTAVEPQSV